MADALSALLQLGPSIVNLASSLTSASDSAKRNTQLIEFQTAIINFQSLIATVKQQNSTLVDRVAELESQIAGMEDWNTEKQRYKMVTAYGSVAALAVQKSMCNGETAHYLCANCFHSGKKSFLAQTANKEGFVGIVCSACKFISQSRFRGLGAAKYAEEHGDQS